MLFFFRYYLPTVAVVDDDDEDVVVVVDDEDEDVLVVDEDEVEVVDATNIKNIFLHKLSYKSNKQKLISKSNEKLKCFCLILMC